MQVIIPKISIVLYCKESTETISQTLSHVLQQTFSNFKCLLVASEFSLCKLAIMDPRVHCMVKQPGETLSDILQKAVQSAEGDFVAFLDDTTIWHENKLQKQISWLDAHPEDAAVFTQASFADAWGNTCLPDTEALEQVLLWGQPNHTNSQWLRILFDKGMCLCLQSMLIRTAYLKDLLYPTAEVLEYNFMLQLCMTARIHIIEEQLTFIRHDLKTASALQHDAYEYFSTLCTFIDTIPDSLFKETFKDRFVYPQASSLFEIQIEKSFLLINDHGFVASIKHIAGAQKFESLLTNPDYKEPLERTYRIDDLALRKKIFQHLHTHPTSQKTFVDPLSAFSSTILLHELLQRVQNKPSRLVFKKAATVLTSVARNKIARIRKRVQRRYLPAEVPPSLLPSGSLHAPGQSQAQDSPNLPQMPDKVIRILFVGIGNSLHTYRWVSTLFGNPRYKLFFFSTYSIPGEPNPFIPEDKVTFDISGNLKEFIKTVRPHIVHTLHTQQAAYPMIHFKALLNETASLWMHSLWGSDLYFWGRYPRHKTLLKECLKGIDILLTEGKRDVVIARQFDFHGRIIDSMPAFGGFDLDEINRVKRVSPSARKEISIKGYENTVGRFFVGLRALEKVRGLLDGYTINVFSPSEPSRYIAELFGIENNLKVHLVEHVPHEHIWAMFARSRICLGVSLSDGLPASLVEGMSMGAFPVQTNTSIADEWLEDGVSGLLIPPNDPDVIAEALRKALVDDALVDEAARINAQTIRERMDRQKLSQKIVSIYNEVANDVIAKA